MMGLTWFGIIVAINMGNTAKRAAEAEAQSGVQTMASNERC
jgi:hypothetical protein